ncbi:Non-classical export protein 1 [Pseudozyma hubeiensis]|nr:Non-classical export protein 1 [Pseudozyma hubeiensis]
MPTYLIGRVSDPILGLATGVMAYFLWENDARNYHERPQGRSLPELVRRRLSGQPPPSNLYAGPEATQRSLFHIPSASHKDTTSSTASTSADTNRSTSSIIRDAQQQAAQNQGERGSDLRALRTAIADEWNQSTSAKRS